MKRREIDARFDAIVEFSGVETVPRHAGEALLERHVRAARVLPSPRTSSRRSCSSTRCSRSATPSSSAGVSDGWKSSAAPAGRCLRLAPAAVDRAALRPRDPDRQRPRRRTTARRPRSSPNYLQRRTAPVRSAVWDRGAAPGNDLARILRVRVLPHDGMPPGVVDVRDPSGSRSSSESFATAKPVLPKIKVLDREGGDRVQRDGRRRALARAVAARRYVATAWIPGNLLNEGSVIVEVADLQHRLPEARASRGGVRGGLVRGARSGEGDSARGSFGGSGEGVVRPLLGLDCRTPS